MREPPESSQEPAPVVVDRRHRWDAVGAIIASLIGLLALAVAGYTAYLQRQQVRAEVWPHLIFGRSNALGQYEFSVLNQGVGPAIVETVEVEVAGRPVSDWKELIAVLGFESKSRWIASTLNRMVLTPGEHLHWIRFDNAADIDAFSAAWERHGVRAHVCYSSALGEHWVADFVPGSLNRPRQVPECPKVDPARQFVD